MKSIYVDESGAFALTDVLEEDLSFGLQVHHSIAESRPTSYITFRKIISTLLTSSHRIRQDGSYLNLGDLMQCRTSASLDAFTFLGFDSRNDDLLASIIRDCAKVIINNGETEKGEMVLENLCTFYMGSGNHAVPHKRNIELFLDHVADALRIGSRTFAENPLLKYSNGIFEIRRVGDQMRKALMVSVERGNLETVEAVVKVLEVIFDQQKQVLHKHSLLGLDRVGEEFGGLTIEQQEHLMTCFHNPLAKFWISNYVLKHEVTKGHVKIPKEIERPPTWSADSFSLFINWCIVNIVPEEGKNTEMFSLHLGLVVDSYLIHFSDHSRKTAPDLAEKLSSCLLPTVAQAQSLLAWEYRINALAPRA